MAALIVVADQQTTEFRRLMTNLILYAKTNRIPEVWLVLACMGFVESKAKQVEALASVVV